WEGQPFRSYALTIGSPLSRDLGIDGMVWSVSSKDELAILGPDGTLARVPLSGGAPRELVKRVRFADWTPDGADLAVIRFAANHFQLEFPIGHVVPLNQLPFFPVRVSRDGQWAAFIACQTSAGPCGVAVVNRNGETRQLGSRFNFGLIGMAWSADNREVWFSSVGGAKARTLFAVDMKGRTRTLLQLPDDAY